MILVILEIVFLPCFVLLAMSNGWAGRWGRNTPIVGEMDSNVDPASSMQVVNALVKAH